MRSPLRTLISSLAGLLVLALTVAAAAPAEARVPRAPRRYSAAIEALAPYVGQTSCDPHLKKGTAELGRLLARTYRGTRWQSTYRCGTDGSRSEHYEGRAIDWMVSVRNRATLAEGRAFATWLLGTDRYGHRFAMARRLGVMYIIFDNRMWGAWDGRWHDYNGCTGKRLSGRVYDNACHRTHMHISLSWNGARGLTTFWTGRVFRTDYGPCAVKGRKYAPRWRHPNFAGCRA